MRYLLAASFLLFFVSTVFCQYVQPDLYSKAKRNPSDFYNVYIVLKDFPDLDQIAEELRTKRMSFSSRHAHVVDLLRQTSAQSQPAFLNKLSQFSDKIKLEEARELWICNSVFVALRGDILETIAALPEVEGVYGEITAEIDGKVEAMSPAFAPNGSEPGLRAIGAQEMWRMGYTGYGRRAVIFDSGGDWNHPALRGNFHGYYVPVQNAWSAPNTMPFDVDGHGTHVAGTILGIDRMRNDTIGVAFNATWIAAPVQFGNAKPQPAPTLDFLSNMQFAVDPNRNGTDLPDVINNSWSGGSQLDCSGNNAFSRAVRSGEVAGVALIWSAGNSGPDPSTVRGYQNVNFDLVAGFAVGATSAFSPFTIADFSSRGPSLCGGSGPLAIKPEVSAPGVNTRSAYVNGTYASLSGTSMASPHVSGAFLLLKEAFPYLAGEEILMALYMSAIDLGPEGEDNIYGRGIINLPAAFNYLVNQGYVPEPPMAPETDALLAGIAQNLDRECNSSIGLDVLIENAGKTAISEMLIEVTVIRGNETCSAPIRWSGSIEPGARANIDINVGTCEEFISNGYFKVGRYEIFVNVLEVNGAPDERLFNNRTRLEVRISGDRPLHVRTEGLDAALACPNTSVVLEAIYDGPGEIEWFTPANSSVPVHVGKRFETPVLGKPVQYFPRPIITNIGISNLEEGDFSSTEPQVGSGLFFDVHDYLRFESVTVFSPRQGVFVFQVCNPQGVCSQVSRVVRTGTNVIPVNLNLTPGQNWSINKVSAFTPFFTTSNVAFPYHYPDIITIKGSDHPDGAYMYFYDWRMTFTNGCPLQPVQVEMISVLQTLELGIVAPDTITMGSDQRFAPELQTGIANEWKLDFGDGTAVINETFPIHQYEKTGRYELKLSARSEDGCMNTIRRSLHVLENEQPLSTENAFGNLQISLFPNPADAELQLRVQGVDRQAPATITISNLMGQVVRVIQSDLMSISGVSVPVQDLPSGVYHLELSVDGAAGKVLKWVKR